MTAKHVVDAFVRRSGTRRLEEDGWLGFRKINPIINILSKVNFIWTSDLGKGAENFAILCHNIIKTQSEN
ncbi:MAG: hypothetical protein V8S33_02090, partial [Intestinibacter bartlettii]